MLVVKDMQTPKQHSPIVLGDLPEVLHLIATHIACILALCAQDLQSSCTSVAITLFLAALFYFEGRRIISFLAQST